MPHLLPIRGDEPPGDTVVIIRAGVMTPESLRRTARDSFDDFGAYLVSVEAVLDGRSVTEVCQRSSRIGDRYGKIRLSSAGRLRTAGLVLLATFARPTSTSSCLTFLSKRSNVSKTVSQNLSTIPVAGRAEYLHERGSGHGI